MLRLSALEEEKGLLNLADRFLSLLLGEETTCSNMSGLITTQIDSLPPRTRKASHQIRSPANLRTQLLLLLL